MKLLKIKNTQGHDIFLNLDNIEYISKHNNILAEYYIFLVSGSVIKIDAATFKHIKFNKEPEK